MTGREGLPEADLRGPFRLIASNVAVITTAGLGGPHGCTGTAWAEDPRSAYVVTPLKRAGETLRHISETRRFAANLLAADQAEIARRFAKRGDRFAGLGYTLGPLGQPLIDGAAVALECELHDSVEFGTYDLLIGRVESARHRPDTPVLTYCDATFGTHLPQERVRV